MSRTLCLAASGAVPAALLRADLEGAWSDWLGRVGLRKAGLAVDRRHSVVHERGADLARWEPLELVAALADDVGLREGWAVALLRTGAGQPMEADTDCRQALTALAIDAAALSKRWEDGRIDRAELTATADELAALVPLILKTIADCRAKAQETRT